ncbi:excinuclease ABC subunit C [candidate division TM6 bacterium RIFCSPHIGHO2_12_FULL_32_22]|nr:MAG: excinuclease ABC subunit C [candidate division TM6 bacterium RIFCSPHIGHO2_12_FULL_32_22]
MHYVYIIKSINFPDQIYVGHTQDLAKRISNHNSGTTSHTDKYKPWRLIMYLCFSNEIKAVEFEKYLKSHSGRAFRDKRLI